MKQIFILGVGRTGSKFYMQLLNTHKDIFVSPELIFRHPVKKDFYTLLQNSIKTKDSIDEIVTKLFHFKERLPFTRTIEKIGRNRLIEDLNKLIELTPYNIFDCIIRLSANVENKSIYGAKFPVHYKYSIELIDYFDTSKIFYLTRDPRAIYISDVKKKKKEKKTKYYRFRVRYFVSAFVLFYTIFEWKFSMKVYEKIKRKFGGAQIRLMKYENIIDNKKIVINDIASFININSEDFNDKLVKIVDSSFENGVSADRWKTNINLVERIIFKLFVGNQMKKYGYR